MSQNTNWQVENLRITVVPATSSKIEASKLWDDMMTLEPDTSQFKMGEYDGRGVVYRNGKMHLVLHKDRVSWLYASKSQEDSAASGDLTIGFFDEELPVIIELASRWLKLPNMLPINRLAFKGILLKPAESLSIAYDYIKELSPFLDFSALNNPYEFEYQILRELDSEILDDQIINRQSKWEVIRLRRSARLLAPREKQREFKHFDFAAKLQLTLETEPKRDGGVLPPERLSKLFDELVTLGKKLSEEGDICDGTD